MSSEASSASDDSAGLPPPVLPSNPDAGCAMEDKFEDLCKELDLEENAARQAKRLFKDSKQFILASSTPQIGSGNLEENERLWSAFVLYCVMKLAEREEKEGTEGRRGKISLCHITKATKLNVADFIKEVPQFCLKAGTLLNSLYGSDWEKKLELKEMQGNVVHLRVLSRFYKRAYQELFVQGDVSDCQPSQVANEPECASVYHRFGWLLFVALRIHEFGRHKDLVTCTNGLVSILAILIVHIPIRFRKFSIQDSALFGKKTNKGVNLMASLCDTHQTSEEELKDMVGKANKLIVDILNKRPRPASECEAENLEHIDTDGLTYFEDLLEEKTLHSSLAILEKDYDDVVDNGDLDERIFSSEDSLLGSGSISGGSTSTCGAKRKFDVMTSPTMTMTSSLSPSSSPALHGNDNPVNGSKVTFTPVSTVMTTAKWMREIISPLPSQPSEMLSHFISSCDKDLTGDVIHRANIILEAIFPSYTFGEQRCLTASLMDSIWAEQRKLEAMKLYYRVLEAICRTESRTLNGGNLNSLLSNERFHRCMLACSAELVLATNKTVTMMFPAVLERTGITAYDLSKVIESFVRHEETLPRELKRHLNSLEERLLESMAWEKGSSMYNSLVVARPALLPEINRSCLLADPMPSLDSIAIQHNISTVSVHSMPRQKHETSTDGVGVARSPKRLCTEYSNVLVGHASFISPSKGHDSAFNNTNVKMPPLQSAFESPSKPNLSGGQMCVEAGINIFFSKIVKLAAIRIRSLSEKLNLPPLILELVYSLIQHILSQHTALLFNRHIDQLILCSFYGIAKVSQLSLTFKEIIYAYKRQTFCKPQVFRSVFVNWSSSGRNGDHVDIITFYNEIFIPSVKPFITELGRSGENKNDNADESPAKHNIDGSYRPSTFPSLPDLSPKRVSGSHNVYVSPLRSSKVDALLSPSSKSYYACVGRSTHDYQSPSKDLSAINDRLNCGRRVKAKLNFEMVSDSIIANSLVPQQQQQNGSSPSSSTADTAGLPVKYKQHEP